MLQQSHKEEFRNPHQETSPMKEYLDALEQPLAPLGEAACHDWRQEAEAHLLSLIAAHEELGLSHEQAVATALREFGNENRIGKNVAYEIHKQKRPPARQFFPGMLATVSLGLGVVGITLLGTTYQSETTAMVHLLSHLLACSLFFIVPVISGWHWQQQTFASNKSKWLPLVMTGVFPLYGFAAGIMYAILFGLRLGIGEAASSMPALVGVLCFSVFAMSAAMLRKRLQASRLEGVQL